MRILLVGYGRMGRLVGELAGQYDCEVAGIVDPQSPSSSGQIDDERWRGIDVAVDFSLPEERFGGQWESVLDTAVPDIPEGARTWKAGEPVRLESRSLVVLRKVG